MSHEGLQAALKSDTMKIPTSLSRGGPNDQAVMTPLIDIVFQLLIFFVCASTGHLRELLLPTDFASGGTAAGAPRAVDAPVSQVWIRLLRDGDITITEIEGTSYRPEDHVDGILKALAETAPDVPLILDISGEVPVGDVVRMVDHCQAAGFTAVHFAATRQDR